jgi:hypothetical protein
VAFNFYSLWDEGLPNLWALPKQQSDKAMKRQTDEAIKQHFIASIFARGKLFITSLNQFKRALKASTNKY